jgi:hypothetical protein
VGVRVRDDLGNHEEKALIGTAVSEQGRQRFEIKNWLGKRERAKTRRFGREQYQNE